MFLDSPGGESVIIRVIGSIRVPSARNLHARDAAAWPRVFFYLHTFATAAYALMAFPKIGRQ